MERILTEIEKEVIKRYALFCDENTNKDKWSGTEYFNVQYDTPKAKFVRIPITDLREFDEKSGERIFADGTYNEDTYLQFYIPKKLMGRDENKIPYWFIAEKIREVISK
jgi:hypothetical protein